MASPEEFPSLDDLLSRHGLVRQDLENKYPAEMRLEIAQLLDDWKMIGYYLGFASQKVNDIKVDNDNEEQRRVALLDAWEQREGEGATYFKLAEVLHHRGRVDLVENLCRMIRRVREEMNVLLLDQSTSTAGINSCVCMKQRLDSLEGRISKLTKQLLQDIEGESITADDILDELTLLPVALRREYQESIKKEMHNITLHVESSANRSIRYIFRLLINPLTTFLDYKLLEHLISTFGNTKLQQDMAVYVDDMNKFKKETTVAELMDHWDGIEDQSLNYSELKVRFGEDPSECTLESLDKRRKRLCSRYRLSELVMVLIHLKPGSFIAVWRIPNLIVGELMESTGQMDDTFFDEDNIWSVFIAGKQAYPTTSPYGDVGYAIEPEGQTIIIDRVRDKKNSKQQPPETGRQPPKEWPQIQSQPTLVTSKVESDRISDTLRWRQGERAPREMYRESDAVVCGNIMYLIPADNEVYAYDATKVWSQLPNCPHEWCSLAVINNLLTTIGGGILTPTNKLFSLTGEGNDRRWTEKFPPMPTKRSSTTSLCTKTSLIVIGGDQEVFDSLTTVEVMKTETYQWSSAADLYHPVSNASAAVCGDRIYVMSRFDPSVYICFLSTLLQSCSALSSHFTSALPPSTKESSSVWKRVTDLPVHNATFVSLNGQLLAVGGNT